MTVLADLVSEISSYASQNVTMTIVSVAWQQGLPNPNDWAVCTLRLNNNGHLPLTAAVITVQCSNHATAALWPPLPNTPPPMSVLPISVGDVPAHGSKAVVFYLKAVAATQPLGAAEQLFNAYLSAHDLTLDHILKDHTGSSSSVAASHSAAVYPQ